MSLTRRLRSRLAARRPGSTDALTVMLVALAVVCVHALCSVHLDQHPHDGGGPLAASQADAGCAPASAHGAVVEAAAAPHGEGSHGCSDHRTVTAQCDPVLPPSLVPAVMPDRSAQRLAPAMVGHDHRTASSVAAAAAPSLHALGISRT